MNRLLQRHDSSRRWTPKKTTRADVWKELKELMKLALPAVLVNVANFGAGLTDAAFVGHLPQWACTSGGVPSQYLAAVGLANTWTAFVYFLVHGFNFAHDTLTSQNFGAGNLERCSQLVQTGLVVVAVGMLPVAVLFWFTADVLEAVFSLDAVTTAIIRQFSRIMILSLPGSLLYDCVAKWTNNMQLVKPSLYCSSISLALNAVMNYALIYGAGLGFVGSPIATVITRTVLPILLLIWLKVRGHTKTMWRGFDKAAVSRARIVEYLRNGLPAGAMILAEIGGFTGMTMMIAWLHDDVAMAAQIAAFQWLFIVYFAPMGIAVATSSRVGAFVGANDPQSARLAAWTAQCLCIAVALLSSLVLLAGRGVLPFAFTSDSDVAALAGKVMIMLCFVHFGDAFQAVGLAVVRGIGRQHIGFWLNVAAYYGVGLPLGAGLAFGARIGIFGVWTGMGCALSALASLVFVHNLTIDWPHECDAAAANTAKGLALGSNDDDAAVPKAVVPGVAVTLDEGEEDLFLN